MLSGDLLAALADAHVGDQTVPGLVALVAHGSEVHVETRGSLAIGGPDVLRDSLFRVASITKPVIGAATLLLAAEGRFRLDEPVSRLLPELATPRVLRRPDAALDDTVPARRPITVRDLLTFTYGFGMTADMFTAPQPWPVMAPAFEIGAIGPPDPSRRRGPDQWIEGVAALPLIAQPGERWLYNTGASVLGVLLARAADSSLDDVLRTRIFDPLGMADTSFWAADTARLATAYAGTAAGLAVWDLPQGRWSAPPAFQDGAAGLVSTADDLLAFARILLPGGRPLLTRHAVAEMTRDQLSAEQRSREGRGLLDGRGWGYCISVVVDGPRAGAFGWNGGLGTSWLVDPVRDLVVIVLTQRLFDSGTPPAVHREIQDAAYRSIS